MGHLRCCLDPYLHPWRSHGVVLQSHRFDSSAGAYYVAHRWGQGQSDPGGAVDTHCSFLG
jgi:hypothetical protein